MNWLKLKSCVGHHIRLQPKAISRSEAAEDRIIDDDWLIERVTKTTGVSLINLRTSHIIDLGTDHIHSYYSDISNVKSGATHGFLKLHSQLVLQGNNVHIEDIRVYHD
jgi:hypothetical protein